MAEPDPFRSTDFKLEDGSANVLGRLYSIGGDPIFAMFDASGNKRIVAGVSGDLAFLAFCTAAGAVRQIFALSDLGETLQGSVDERGNFVGSIAERLAPVIEALGAAVP